jgi:hypothetical protein
VPANGLPPKSPRKWLDAAPKNKSMDCAFVFRQSMKVDIKISFLIRIKFMLGYKIKIFFLIVFNFHV